MNKRSVWLSGLVIAALAASGSVRTSDEHRVNVAVEAEKITVQVDGKLFTTLHADKVAHKLYLHPVNSASGRRVTRAFPMEQVAGESTDHEHQRGVWIGAERVSGIDFWENEESYDATNKGNVLLTSVTDVRSGADEGRFTINAAWNAPNGETKVTETRTMAFRADGEQRIIDINLRLTAKTAVTFEDNHDALLGLRLGTTFEEANGGKAVNAEGKTGWESLRGARSAWVDWRATVDGENLGVAVMDHPKNFRYPTPWHVRDYALLFASPFASKDYSPSAPDGSVTLKPGEDLRMRYRIVVHSASFDAAQAFHKFAGQ